MVKEQVKVVEGKTSSKENLKERLENLGSIETESKTRTVTLVVEMCCGCGCNDEEIIREVPIDSELQNGDRVKEMLGTDKFKF